MKGIKKGSRIAVTGGSRGIQAIDKITLAGNPGAAKSQRRAFCRSGDGSHGGATAEGRKKSWPLWNHRRKPWGFPFDPPSERGDDREIGKMGFRVFGQRKPFTATGSWSSTGETSHRLQG